MKKQASGKMSLGSIARATLCALVIFIQSGCGRQNTDILPISSDSAALWKERSSQLTSDNCSTARQLFFLGYRDGHIIFFGKGSERKTHLINEFKIDIIPEVKTHDQNNGKRIEEVGNVAGHLNQLALLLAYKWIIEGKDEGSKLLDILKAENPTWEVSIVGLDGLKLSDLRSKDITSTKERIEMLTWEWRSREDMAK